MREIESARTSFLSRVHARLSRALYAFRGDRDGGEGDGKGTKSQAIDDIRPSIFTFVIYRPPVPDRPSRSR